MLRRDPNYTRLPGGGRTFTGIASYWLASDHLLLVEVHAATESYRRFDLREIRSFALMATRMDWFYRGFLGSGFLLFLAVPVASFMIKDRAFRSGDWIDLVGFGAAATFFLIGLLWTLYAGQSCRIEMQTSVQTVRLPGLDRWRKTEKFLTALSFAVQAAQADLVPAPARVTDEPTTTASVPTPPTTEEPLPNS